MTTKIRCTRCGRDKPSDWFLPAFKTCKACRNARSDKKRKRIRTMCVGCDGTFPPEAFHTSPIGRSNYCPNCREERRVRKQQFRGTGINPTEILGGDMKYLMLLRRPLKDD